MRAPLGTWWRWGRTVPRMMTQSTASGSRAGPPRCPSAGHMLVRRPGTAPAATRSPSPADITGTLYATLSATALPASITGASFRFWCPSASSQMPNRYPSHDDDDEEKSETRPIALTCVGLHSTCMMSAWRHLEHIGQRDERPARLKTTETYHILCKANLLTRMAP